ANEILVYPVVRQAGSKEVTISSGIKNTQGYPLKTELSFSLAFEQMKPQVRFLGKGTILPSSKGLILPFETVALNEVDVRIIRIYEENIAQFLQVNTLNDRSEMKRVGRPIALKNVKLNNSGNADMSSWSRYSLDLAEMIQAEPGAIYQVDISFSKEYATYVCKDESEADETVFQNKKETTFQELEEEYDKTTWDYYDDYYYYGYYDWENRDNPCHPAYYGSRRSVAKNVLASDLGIIAKRGNNGAMIAAVTDLLTTAPLSNVEVAIYNFQNQLLDENVTDSEGLVTLDPKKKPFLLVASQGNQRGYLKLDDGSSLSVSNFDVRGQEVQKGLKGFLYGERGVWRPGDTLFLNFILEDKDKVLPQNHPVVFQLQNPLGQIVKKSVSNSGIDGFYHFTAVTEADAPTGNWTAKVLVGGTTFTKNIKIETVKPNRLKINLDFESDKLTVSEKEIKANLEVKWLHGAPAPNLKAEFELDLSKSKTVFRGYELYNFDDKGKQFNSENQQVFSGRLDGDGKAVINTKIDVGDKAPGVLQANFRGKVFEEGGNFSVDRIVMPYYPYSSFVGLKLPETKSWSRLFYDKENTLQIITLDDEGNPVDRQGVVITVHRLRWSWWWNQNDEDVANYISQQNRIPEVTGKVNTSGGKADFNFELDNWGRYYITVCDPISGHCAGEIHYTSWGGNADDMPSGATMLSFSAEKESYKVGEKVSLSIPGSKNGRALVSIENGRKVLQTFWLQTEQGDTPFSFDVTDEMAPNIFVNVSLIQPHGQTINDLPIRLYGVIPVLVDNPETHLKPEIEMPDVLEPEQVFEVKVSEATGRPMTYTLAVVDEGLLDLTRFKTPDPWNRFYAREALGVKTWDLYDHVMGAFSGSLGRLLAIGGGGVEEVEENSKANRFKPVVKHLGPFQLAEGEANVHKIKMPRYIGSVKTMVVAAREGAYGNVEKVTPVKKSLMVLGTLPRVLGPEEKVKLPVNIFVSDPALSEVTVQVATNDLVTLPTASKKVSVSKSGEQMVYFDLDVKATTGIGKVKITASANGVTATDEVEIDVRNPNPPVTNIIEGMVQPGETWNASYGAIGIAGTNSGVVEVSRIPPINLGKRLSYLIRYPYGCIEQTVSSGFPQLLVTNLLETTPENARKIEANVRATINRLKSFQNTDGGMAYWPGSQESNEWGSVYAYHFLIEAEKKGYQVPTFLKANLKRYLRRTARNWRYNSGGYRRDDMMQAYRLYALALSNDAETGAMNRLRETKGLTVQGKWRLAAAYFLIGQNKAGGELVKGVSTDIRPYTELAGSYGSSIRDQAMILETLCLMDDKAKGFELLKTIAGRLSSDNWLSTQTTAYSLIAIAKFAGLDNTSSGMKFDLTLPNTKTISASTELSVIQKQLDMKAGEVYSLSMVNNSKTVLFTRIIAEGTPARGDQSAAENNLKLSVRYLDRNDKEIDPASLMQGTDFIVEARINNPGMRGDYEEMVLNQVFPSGWEILNSRMDGASQRASQQEVIGKPEYQDIRDDRVYTFFDLKANETKIFRLRLNASYTGEFYLPTISCEAMYDHSINARKPGKVVNVVAVEDQ
ncbi:MAG: MG2 domain-containing protein, partial [Bacteroidota bacterium]